MVLTSVEDLSGDELENDSRAMGTAKPVRVKPVKRLREPRKGFKTLKVVRHHWDHADPSKLRRLVSRSCSCRCDCFNPFNEDIHLFDTLVKCCKSMSSMTKLEKDRHAMN